MAEHTIAERHVVRPTLVAACAVLCLLLGLVLAGALATPHAESSQSGPVEASGNTVGSEASPPTLAVKVFVSGLNIPWDIAFAPDGTMLFTQRGGVLSSRLADGTVQTVSADLGDLFARGETGLMAIVVDPGFASNRRFYTCQGHSGPEVQVIAWTIDSAYASATRVADPLVAGLPTAGGGRHGGCRLRFGPQGYLWISTGDGARGTNPQDLTSLGGKVLRVDASTGAAAPGNPFGTRIYSYGHRNVQGLALRPGTSQMWSVEHGPSRDDEINLLTSGGNYGWNPVPGYNQNVPMTGLTEFPDAVEARWSSGNPTLATSGGIFLEGEQWGSWEGRLAVATLKRSELRLFEFTADGAFVSEVVVQELDRTYGRLRTPMLGPDGALYVSTSNGSGGDRILRIVATATTEPPVEPPPGIFSGDGGGGGAGGGGGGAAAPTGPTLSDEDFAWNVSRDIDALDAGNDGATGLWGDCATIWVAQNSDGGGDGVYAYDLASGERVEDREFELDTANLAPRGLWSDRETIWVSDSGKEKLFAHDLESGERLEDRDLALGEANGDARGIWSDGETMWVLDGRDESVYLYDLGSGEQTAVYEFDSANDDPHGVWSDGTTVWVSNHEPKRLFAYRLVDGALVRESDEDFTTLSPAGNNSPRGIWSDDSVIYVVDALDAKIYSYNMPDGIDARLASLTLTHIDIGEFSPGRTEYTGILTGGAGKTVIEASPVQPGATVAIVPSDVDGDLENGHQAGVDEGTEVRLTVTSEDGSRERVYRVAVEVPECLRGLKSARFSLVVYAGGHFGQLEGCARSKQVTAFYSWVDGDFVRYILGAPDFVNERFRALFPNDLPADTPLIAQRDLPAAPDTGSSEGEGGE